MSEETLSRISEWCEAADDLDLEDGTVTVAGDPPIRIAVDVTDEAALLSHTQAVAEAPEGFAGEARALLGGRGSMLEGEVADDADGTRVEVRYPIYLDGLNRQTFLLAVRDITATADAVAVLGGRAAAGVGDAAPVAEGEEEPGGAEPAPEEEAAPETGISTATGPSEAEDTPAAAAAVAAAAEDPSAEPEPARPTAETVIVDPAAWAPTHTVPGGGMTAWAEPDPALAPAAKLAARVELRMDEQRGMWARVTGSNGWTGWVDARKLRPLGMTVTATRSDAATATAKPATAGRALRPLALLGGLAMIVSVFIPWNATGTAIDGSYTIPDTYSDAMGWPFAFVYNRLSPAQPKIGIIVLILALILLTAAFLPRIPAAVPILAGLLAVVIGGLFLIQFVRAPGWSDTLKILQAGFWVFLVSGVVAAVPYRLDL